MEKACPSNKRYLQEQKTKRAGEKPETKAARNTAHATVAIAVFTVALAVVAWLQYQEVQDSGDSMDRMNRIYRAQVVQLGRQAGETHELAVQAKNQTDRTKEMSARMKDQADQTKRIANQAIVQANAARSASVTAQNSLKAFEDAQSPILDIKVVWDNKEQDVIFEIRNIGQSAAKEIVYNIESGGVPLPPNRPVGWPDNFKIKLNPQHPQPGGRLLLPADPPLRIPAQMGTPSEDVLMAKRFDYRAINIGFKDVFGREQSAYACTFWANIDATYRKCYIIRDGEVGQDSLDGPNPHGPKTDNLPLWYKAPRHNQTGQKPN